MSILAIVNLVLFTALLSLLYQLGKNESSSLSRRVLIGLIAGTIFGFYMKLVFGGNEIVLSQTMEWTNVVANSCINP